MQKNSEPLKSAGRVDTGNSLKATDKTNALITGSFFIAATVSAIMGVRLYDPILNHSDYLTNGAKNSTQIIFGALSELVLVCTAAGTGIMLFPYLRRFNERLGLGYITFRLLEAVLILIGIVSVLALLSLSHSYTNEASPAVNAFQTVGTILKAIHDWTSILGPLFMLGINTFIYSYVFYQTNLVPRRLAIFGIVGAVLVFISAPLVMLGIIAQLSVMQVLMAMPIAIYEMVLAVWLISKGFNVGHFMQQNN